MICETKPRFVSAKRHAELWAKADPNNLLVSEFIEGLTNVERAMLDVCCLLSTEFREGSPLARDVVNRLTCSHVDASSADVEYAMERLTEFEILVFARLRRLRLAKSITSDGIVLVEHPSERRFRLKEKLLEHHNRLCAYCGRQFNSKRLTIDHIVPVSRSGSDLLENLVVACKQCNRTKGDRTPEEWALDIMSYRSIPRRSSLRRLVARVKLMAAMVVG